MEFLVHIIFRWPPELPLSERDALKAAERARGLELRRAGTIGRIWRLPGQQANIGIWRAVDATQLHHVLASLPLVDFMEIVVVPLAKHYLEDDT